MALKPFEPGETPDVYTDAVRIGSGVYGFSFQFGLATESPGEQRPVVTVRMSPQHAVVFYQILKKHLRQYEDRVGKIALPDGLFEELEIEREI